MALWTEKMNSPITRRNGILLKIDIRSEKLQEIKLAIATHPVDAVAYLSSWLTKETGLLYYEDFYWDHTNLDDNEMVWVFKDNKIATFFKVAWG